ncbi:MAG: hypothetical protein A2Y62_20170 [Candidatus Fischerbacteria bacterium RBG_13_37_8]|uniref:Cupin 2 conserved barrel domain-containing protein n=1 Tax=Candidatus Fischerbacteria bacterium RBG_13_37_8 TaxID=1817863 RepID=A0A1F5V5E1_9BACT|nr:MAG: hypothetical protein A2Y62_20170 [Candidatus Fischerbacteria bacterium RBG_13_37_8]
MKIEDVPFTVTDWTEVTAFEQKGDTGTSYWRVFQDGNVRVRIVEYTANYRSDHWCSRGHVFLVLEGEFTIELKDGRKFVLIKGMSFQASDDFDNPHIGYSENGAKAFIVD